MGVLGWIIATVALGLTILTSSEAAAKGTSANKVFEQAGFGAHLVDRAEPAPELILTGLDGNLYRVKDYKGRVVILHFWASWCVPCRVEMPALQSLYKELGNKGLVVLGVAEDSSKNVMAFQDEHGLGLPVLIDQYGKGMRAYGIKAIPSSVVIGRDGAIKAYVVGKRDYASPEAVEFFKKFLDEEP